jgi:hypothetical protein
MIFEKISAPLFLVKLFMFDDVLDHFYTLHLVSEP